MSPSHNFPRGLDLDVGRYIEVDAAIIMELSWHFLRGAKSDFSAGGKVMSVGNLFESALLFHLGKFWIES